MGMIGHAIEITDIFTDEMNGVIGAGLNTYNDEVTKFSDGKPLAIIVRDKQTADVIGSQPKITQPRMIIRPPAQRPVVFAVRLRNRQIVYRRMASPH